MSSDPDEPRSHQRWAHLRFSIVGPLLAAPPKPGELKAELQRLAAKVWRHPITGEPRRFGFSTIQRWYYRARDEKQDPVAVLRRKRRRDSGRQRALPPALRQRLHAQYSSHRSWSYQLHVDNLRALVKESPKLGPMPSYATVRRYMKSAGLIKQRRRRRFREEAVEPRLELEPREIRSFEAEYVHGLWHADFHHSSLKVLTPQGLWITPQLLAVLDDHSRLACHAQWYLGETAEHLVHGLTQALQKRGLPRQFLRDNGAAMLAREVEQGLLRLGIHSQTTLPYCPYQNGKQEVFFAQVEGRLLAMLENCRDLRLDLLNEATQAWVEMEYNRSVHSETAQPPLDRFLEGPSVARECPSSSQLRLAFCIQSTRTQRRSDGTITVEGIRFELPNRYRHLQRVTIRYARWDLSCVHMVDDRDDTVLCRLVPQDKTKNADGRRRSLQTPPKQEDSTPPEIGIAPLLRQLMQEYAETGLPPAYLPKIPLTQEDV